MLDLRYGGRAGVISGVVMWAYTLMLATTSTIAYATVFDVLFDMNRTLAIVLGGSIVVAYCRARRPWVHHADGHGAVRGEDHRRPAAASAHRRGEGGGFGEMRAKLPTGYFDPLGIGGETIFTYVLIYTFGMLIGQDIWQRVFTARSDTTARWGGTVAGTYCLAYALAGAVIGTAAKVLYPNLANADDAFATIVKDELPVGVRGLVLAAALAAVMSTSSGALIACATVANNDIWSRLRGAVRQARDERDNQGEVGEQGEQGELDEVRGNRAFILVMGVAVIGTAIALNNVVEALTVAYNLLVGGLLVPILGGLLWKRGTVQGALASVIVGGLAVVGLMASYGILANQPVYYGLLSSLAAYLVVSLATPATDAAVLAAWRERLAGRATEPAYESVPAPQ
ncbi:Sodium:solute symporter OS=Streptomyces alboniger OX=132473 GN=CP975_12435 PE=3 SV=1 [Streptomyces alboniger]